MAVVAVLATAAIRLAFLWHGHESGLYAVLSRVNETIFSRDAETLFSEVCRIIAETGGLVWDVSERKRAEEALSAEGVAGVAGTR